MRSLVLAFVGLVGVLEAQRCNIFSPGHWVSQQAVGMTDFASGGVATNPKYFCFDGCLATSAMVSDMRILLGNTTVPKKVKARRSPAQLQALRKKAALDGDDPNAFGCVDDGLRANIANALTKVTAYNAKGILQALQYNLNLPGWAMIVADFQFEASEIFQDINYCDYDALVGASYYSICMAKLDMS
ncbi:unnamed protein product, partial [Mesorhabditis belari]|uniref:Uncharacterized protein n=1 Tax=Mesorhabditis belari TaxID=2138241 RepID=A0AAF3FK80_9BILA